MGNARKWKAWLGCTAALTSVLFACTPGERDPLSSRSSAVTSWSNVTTVAGTYTLSTPSQRHLVRLAPAGQSPVLLMAVQRDAYSSPDPEGLHFYRSDDEGRTWRYYKPIFKDGTTGREIHLTADLLVVGDDIAMVLSYDTTNTGFPSDSVADPNRKVYFQWWRYDGSGGWNAAPMSIVSAPPSGFAYHRAVLAQDSASRLWVAAWLRDPCAATSGSLCFDTIRIFESEDSGASFTREPDLYRSTRLGGGRLISLGSRLMMLWGDYSWDVPARYAIRNDSDAVGVWQAPVSAFADGDSIYHGSALSAVADGQGGLDLVYKERAESLYYRHFDGSAFGGRTLVDGNAYYTMQPSITRRGSEVFVCVNHPVVPGQPNYEMRSFALSKGFNTWVTLGTTTQTAGYTAAPERVPADAPGIPCGMAAGDWPATLRVGVRWEAAAPSPTPTPTPTPTPVPSPTATPLPTPTPAPNGNLPISTLRDPWTSLDPTMWSVITSTAGDGATAASGVLTLTTTPSNPAGRVFVKSKHLYVLDESAVYVNLQQVVNAIGGVNVKFRIESPANPWNEGIGFWYEQGSVSAFVVTGGLETDAAAFPWNAADDAWLRLRDAGTTLYWDTSADGVVWVQRASTPESDVRLPLDGVTLVFDMKEYSAGNPAPGAGKFAKLNGG